MTPNDDLFQYNRLEEQLATLAESEGQPPITPISRAYSHLRQFHAAQAEQEARAIERVRLRLEARAAHAQPQQEFQREPALSIVPRPLPAQEQRSRRISRLNAFLSSVAAVLVVGFLVGGFVALLHARQVGPGASSVNQYTWQVMPSPNTSLPINALTGVAFSGSTDGWAVGMAKNGTTVERPLIEHWNGQHWQIVSTPTLPNGGIVSDVVSLTPDNAWAVGAMYTASDQTTAQALIEHWDGHQWTVAPPPTSGTISSRLKKLVALSANNIWAVGSFSDGTMNSGALNFHGLIEHWNGQQWQIIAAPSQSENEQFNSITALAPDNIWAAGYSRESDEQPVQTLVEHWDGSQWSIVPSPNPSASVDALTGISAVAANDIWAVGAAAPTDATYTGANCCYAALIEHWDGQRWSIVASPPTGMALLYDIIALEPGNIWAIGETWQENSPPGQAQGLIEHWDGQRWSLIPNPHPRGYTALSGITSDPSVPGKLWIVGSVGAQDRAYDCLSDSTFIETSR